MIDTPGCFDPGCRGSGRTMSHSPLFHPVPAIRDDTSYRGAYVRLASGYEEDVAGDRVIKLSPGGSAAYVSHTLALSGSWPSFIGKKRSREWKTWICPLDMLSLKLSGWLPVGHRCICAWVNVRRCSAMWLSRRLLRYFTQREMVSQRSPAAHPPSLHHQSNSVGLNRISCVCDAESIAVEIMNWNRP